MAFKYCVKPGCTNAVQKTNLTAKVCPRCKENTGEKALEAVEETFGQRFDKVIDNVSKKLSSKTAHHNLYVTPMLKHLKGCDEFFKRDFCSEMYDTSKMTLKDSNLQKLLDPTKRASGHGTSCVDQALDGLRLELARPKEYPKGEKFDFELPYILKDDKWEFLHDNNSKPFSAKFKALCESISGDKVTNRYYLLIAKASSANNIGHMIALIMDQNGKGWVRDKQGAAKSYGPWVYMGWMLDSTDVAKPTDLPGLNLKTGDVGD